MIRPQDIRVEDDGHRGGDGELSRLRAFWLHVIALAVADQDADWISRAVSGRDLILEAAGIEPGYWDRLMLPLADAIRTEHKLSLHEQREPRSFLPGVIERKRLRHSGLGAR